MNETQRIEAVELVGAFNRALEDGFGDAEIDAACDLRDFVERLTATKTAVRAGFTSSNGYTIFVLDDGQVCMTKKIAGRPLEHKLWLRDDESLALREYFLSNGIGSANA